MSHITYLFNWSSTRDIFSRHQITHVIKVPQFQHCWCWMDGIWLCKPHWLALLWHSNHMSFTISTSISNQIFCIWSENFFKADQCAHTYLFPSPVTNWVPRSFTVASYCVTVMSTVAAKIYLAEIRTKCLIHHSDTALKTL